MSDFLVDTLVWTGILLALVLLIRRPVAALFGPKIAYALWALPMARLLLPPLVLPAWLAPRQTLDPALAPVADGLAATPHAAGFAAVPMAVTPAQAGPAHMEALAAVDWASLLMPLWLGGAAVFLIRRYALYFRMRRELLARARPMGEHGRIRLVETPAADGPVAFGVIDKVVALPVGFMAGRDRVARDLALAHELAHHRGHDLVCNMLVQPLFALHWFNPLGLLGWRALRRDQEAACDARVIAAEPRERKAVYAAVIARYATQTQHTARLALAAPMVCPVLGDRSIVQRLRGLTMTDISATRRWLGRGLIAAAAVALPLTGSISYAQSETVPDAPTPPAPPAAPEPPTAPAAPAPPAVVIVDKEKVLPDDEGTVRIMRIERDGPALRAGDRFRMVDRDRIERMARDGKSVRQVIVRDGKYTRDGREMTVEERAEFDKEMKALREEMRTHFGKDGELQRELSRELGPDSAFAKEMRKTFGPGGELAREIEIAVAEAHSGALAGARAAALAPRVRARCRDGQKEVSETVVGADGKQDIFICSALATADARRALADARAEVAWSRDISDKQRAKALKAIDQAEREIRAD